MPGEAYRRIWETTLAAAWGEGALEGLLVSRHGMRFFGRREGSADRAFHAAQRRREREALERLDALTALRVETWHDWFFFWDGLSLFCCEGWTSPWSYRLPLAGGGSVELVVRRRAPDPGAPGGETVTISPFPFRAPFRVEAPVAIVPGTAFPDQEALDEAWMARRVERRWWRIAEG
jgi:hypothetical protein